MKNLKFFFFFLILLLFFYDLGNINGLRQGTEGFYLLISQEMYEAGDLLTPRIYGDYHWSKPPFQFWLPMGFFKLFGGSYLYWARFSILVFSLACILIISRWYEDELKRNWHEGFLALIVPFYFIKYSRIFMMEAALTLLSTLGAICFYSYLKRGKRFHLIWGSLFAGLSVLVKGPVSLVMIGPPLFIYMLLTKRSIKDYIKFVLLGSLIGSLWFIASYVRFGDDFFNYFFIRENLGKFHSKSYPIRHVIQGLLIYSFPIWLLIPAFYKEMKKNIRHKEINWFFLLSFGFFFFLWFIPKQRSHHYAVPSIPFLCLFVIYNFHEARGKGVQYFRKLSTPFHLFVGFQALLIGLFYYFKEDLAFEANHIYFLGAFFCLGLWSYLNQKEKITFPFLRFVVPLQLLWLFLLPMGILPVVPPDVADIINTSEQNVYVRYRKPFFVMESVEKEIALFPQDGLSSSKIKSGDLVFIEEKVFKDSPYSNQFQALKRWKVWIRGSDTKDILGALGQRSLKSLQEFYTIVQKK